MAHHLYRLTPFLQSTPVMRNRCCGVATAAHGRHHPNPGNFANRPKEELSEIGHRGGKKGGKARGVGGFHEMDPEKQHKIASKGGRAEKRARAEMEEAVKETQRREPSVFGGSAEEPSVAPPGFPEWKTSS